MGKISEESHSNTRALSILLGYLTLCLALPTFLLTSFARDLKTIHVSRQTSLRLFVFLSLAIGSLGSTWYHMVRFFIRSYVDWASERDLAMPPGLYGESSIIDFDAGASPLYLGLWLRDTQLFRQAWETVVTGSGRWWWSQQIFLITAVWGVFLGRAGEEGSSQRHPRSWLLCEQI